MKITDNKNSIDYDFLKYINYKTKDVDGEYDFNKLQISIAERLAHHNAVFCFDEVGIGKTMMAYISALYIMQTVKRPAKILFLNPSNIIMDKNYAEIDNHLRTDKGSYFDMVKILPGTETNKSDGKKPTIYFALFPRTSEAQERIKVVQGSDKFDLIIIDEAHQLVCNNQEQVFKGYNGDTMARMETNCFSNVSKLKFTKVLFLTASPIKYDSAQDFGNYKALAEKVEKNFKDLDFQLKEFNNLIFNVENTSNTENASIIINSAVTRFFKENSYETSFVDAPDKKDKTRKRNILVWSKSLKDEIDDIEKSDDAQKINRYVIFVRNEFQGIEVIQYLLETKCVQAFIGKNQEVIPDQIENLKNEFANLMKKKLEVRCETYKKITSIISFQMGKFYDNVPYTLWNGETLYTVLEKYSTTDKPEKLPKFLILSYQIGQIGINLPSYNYVINYHITSAPCDLEQRFGRIDRYNSVNNELNNVYYVHNDVTKLIEALSNYITEVISIIPTKNILFNNATINTVSNLLSNHQYIDNVKFCLKEKIISDIIYLQRYNMIPREQFYIPKIQNIQNRANRDYVKSKYYERTQNKNFEAYEYTKKDEKVSYVLKNKDGELLHTLNEEEVLCTIVETINEINYSITLLNKYDNVITISEILRNIINEQSSKFENEGSIVYCHDKENITCKLHDANTNIISTYEKYTCIQINKYAELRKSLEQEVTNFLSEKERQKEAPKFGEVSYYYYEVANYVGELCSYANSNCYEDIKKIFDLPYRDTLRINLLVDGIKSLLEDKDIFYLVNNDENVKDCKDIFMIILFFFDNSNAEFYKPEVQKYIYEHISDNSIKNDFNKIKDRFNLYRDGPKNDTLYNWEDILLECREILIESILKQNIYYESFQNIAPQINQKYINLFLENQDINFMFHPEKYDWTDQMITVIVQKTEKCLNFIKNEIIPIILDDSFSDASNSKYKASIKEASLSSVFTLFQTLKIFRAIDTFEKAVISLLKTQSGYWREIFESTFYYTVMIKFKKIFSDVLDTKEMDNCLCNVYEDEQVVFSPCFKIFFNTAYTAIQNSLFLTASNNYRSWLLNVPIKNNADTTTIEYTDITKIYRDDIKTEIKDTESQEIWRTIFKKANYN